MTIGRPAKRLNRLQRHPDVRIAILDDYQGVALNFGGWHALPKEVQVVLFTDHVKDDDLLVARLSDFDAVCRMRERTAFPKHILQRLPRLKLLLATGIRNNRSIDIPAVRALGITVCSTSSLSYPTVELTWGMILALFRRIVSESGSVRAGGWQLKVGSSVRGKTLGVLGLGTMGIPVAAIGRAFGMNIIAWSPNLTPERAEKAGAMCVTKAELFSSADVVTIHMPLSERSMGIVGAEDIARMKPAAFLINTSRSPLVDEDALIAALRAEWFMRAWLPPSPISISQLLSSRPRRVACRKWRQPPRVFTLAFPWWWPFISSERCSSMPLRPTTGERCHASDSSAFCRH
jgi:phosphoglycerate dehydrogenase-like enzyme